MVASALISRAASPAEGDALVVRDFPGRYPVRHRRSGKPDRSPCPLPLPRLPVRSEPVDPVAARLRSDPPVEVPLPPLEARLAASTRRLSRVRRRWRYQVAGGIMDGSVAPTSAEMLGPPAPPANAVVSTTFALPAETAVLLSAPPRPQSPSTSAAMPILPLPALLPCKREFRWRWKTSSSRCPRLPHLPGAHRHRATSPPRRPRHRWSSKTSRRQAAEGVCRPSVSRARLSTSA